MGKSVFLYTDGDPDQSENLMGSRMHQDLSSDFLEDDPTSSICIILLTTKQTDKRMVMKINTFMVEVMSYDGISFKI